MLLPVEKKTVYLKSLSLDTIETKKLERFLKELSNMNNNIHSSLSEFDGLKILCHRTSGWGRRTNFGFCFPPKAQSCAFLGPEFQTGQTALWGHSGATAL